MQVGEIIYDNIPILFENESSRNEYSDRLKRITEKLLEASESKTVTEFLVKLVYGEDFCLPARLLDTKIEVHGKLVADAVRSLHNQGYVMEAKFGREGSPVLYVQPPYWENQASNYVRKEEHSPRKYAEEERARMYRAIKQTLGETSPDELDVDHLGYVRAWWD